MPPAKEDCLRRLRKIEGQIHGLQKMIEADTWCLDPAIGALAMSGPGIIVAVNALALKWLKLPASACLRRIEL